MPTINLLLKQPTPWRPCAALAILLGIWLVMWSSPPSVLAQDVAFPLPEQLTLTVRNNQTVLDWVYTVEPTVVIYQLERGESRTYSEATVVTASLLSSTGDGEPVVLYYTLIDATAQPGRGYAYWLTVTDAQGTSATLGPLTTGEIDDASEHQHQLFLPMVTSR